MLQSKDILNKYNEILYSEDYFNNYQYNSRKILANKHKKFLTQKKYYVNKKIEEEQPTHKKGMYGTLEKFQNLYIMKFLTKPKKQSRNKPKSSKFRSNMKLNTNKTTQNFDFNNYMLKNNKIEKKKENNQEGSIESFYPSIFNKNFKKNLELNPSFAEEFVKNLNNENKNMKNSNSKVKSGKTRLNKNLSAGHLFIGKNEDLFKRKSFFENNNENKKLSNINGNKYPTSKLNNDLPISVIYSFDRYPLIKSLDKINSNKTQNNNNNIILPEAVKNKKSAIINYNKKQKLIKDDLHKVQYREISRDSFKLSDICVIKRSLSPYTNKKHISAKRQNKDQKIPIRIVSAYYRNMTALQRYYFKFGIYSYY